MGSIGTRSRSAYALVRRAVRCVWSPLAAGPLASKGRSAVCSHLQSRRSTARHPPRANARAGRLSSDAGRGSHSVWFVWRLVGNPHAAGRFGSESIYLDNAPVACSAVCRPHEQKSGAAHGRKALPNAGLPGAASAAREILSAVRSAGARADDRSGGLVHAANVSNARGDWVDVVHRVLPFPCIQAVPFAEADGCSKFG